LYGRDARAKDARRSNLESHTMHPTRSLGLLSLLLLSSSAFAGIRHVDASLTTGANDGSSWANAYRGIDAIPVAVTAAVAGDEVWVKAGTYRPTATATRTISINLKNGVAIYGGFAGTETALAQRDFVANPTIISGDLAGNDATNIFTDNSYHVLNGASQNATAVIDGFTITGGNANSTANNDRGGGILCLSGSSPTVRNCIFRANRCTFGGGAGYINSSSPTFTNCQFLDNVGGSFGGAFDMATSVSATFDRCFFRGNTAARAGAIEIFGGSTTKVYNCIFVGNTATGSGGGGAIWVGSSSNPVIRNTTIHGNSATASAAGGVLASGSTVSMANCIVWANTGTGGAQGATNQLNGATFSVGYSIVLGGAAGTGNLAFDPQFANAAGGDFRLLPTSPAIDAGSNAFVPATVSLDHYGSPRFADEPLVPDTGAGTAPVVDIGHHEYPAPRVESYCFGDPFGGPCPCNNYSALSAGEGCANSLGLGAILGWSGSARLNGDTFALLGSQMPNSTCLYFQGTTQTAAGVGTAFGDGLRCASGTVVRLGTKANVGGASQYPAFGDLSVSVKGGIAAPGTTRTYQVWYRNAAAFCTTSTFNLTNALQVTWEL
jgi:parallel beta-helix repeat protein